VLVGDELAREVLLEAVEDQSRVQVAGQVEAVVLVVGGGTSGPSVPLSDGGWIGPGLAGRPPWVRKRARAVSVGGGRSARRRGHVSFTEPGGRDRSGAGAGEEPAAVEHDAQASSTLRW
jgi:hypothetical protein